MGQKLMSPNAMIWERLRLDHLTFRHQPVMTCALGSPSLLSALRGPLGASFSIQHSNPILFSKLWNLFSPQFQMLPPLGAKGQDHLYSPAPDNLAKKNALEVNLKC